MSRAGGRTAFVCAEGLVLATTPLTVWVLAGGMKQGFDISDDGFYLAAAETSAAGDAANGLWGLYTGLIYRAVGYSVVSFRLAGLIILAASAHLLGRRLVRVIAARLDRRLSYFSRLAIPVATSMSAVVYYAPFLMTPSYNWLALVGIVLAMSGFFGLLGETGSRRRHAIDALLVTGGCFLAFWARPFAGMGVWLVIHAAVFLLAPTVGRRRLLVGAVASLATVGSLHSLMVLGPSETVATMRRIGDFNLKYGLSPSLGTLVGTTLYGVLGIPAAVLTTAGLWPVSGFSSAVAGFFPLGVRERLISGLTAGSLALVSVRLVFGGGFRGGASAYSTLAPGVLALIACALFAWAGATLARRREPRQADVADNRLSMVIAGTCTVAAALYAFSSGNAFLEQLSGAYVLLMVALLALLIRVTGNNGVPAVAGVVSAVAVVAVALSISDGREHPYRSAPIDASAKSVTVNSHHAALLVAPEYANYLDSLQSHAKAAGFQRGTPLIDLTPFSPGSVYALGARQPSTIIFGFSTESASWALSQQPADDWRNAWLLVRGGESPSMKPATVVRQVGREFPADYELVTKVDWPWGSQRHELWRPREGRG